MRKYRDWLFLDPKKSPNWYLRLPAPADLRESHAWKPRTISTGQPTYAAAELWALRHILVHKQNIATLRELTAHLATNPIIERQAGGLKLITTFKGNIHTEIMPDYAPGDVRTFTEGHVKCTKDGLRLQMFDADGDFLGECPNTKSETRFAGKNRLHADIRDLESKIEKDEVKSLDREVFDLWAKSRTKSIVDDGKRALNRLKLAASGKSFMTLTETDVRKFVAAMEAEELASTTQDCQLSHLKGMCTVALAHKELFPTIRHNPFSIPGLVVQGQEGRRAPVCLYTDEDLDRIALDLPTWRADERLLWTMLRTMGARLDEPFQIRGEHTHKGFRCIEWGTKGRDKRKARRVMPLSGAVMRLLPEPIPQGQSPFPFGHSNTNSRMRDRLTNLGLPPNSGKSAQSLRHGVETELGNIVPARIIDAIMGHVPDDLNKNQDAAQQRRRAMSSIQNRYFRGNEARDVFDAIEMIQTGI